MSDSVTQDFIFGTLATDDLRLEALRAEGRGVFHGDRIAPADPEPGQAVELRVDVGTEVDDTQVIAFFTVDGSDPTLSSAWARLKPAEVVWDTLQWGYRRVWRGELPAQAEGTRVRYRVRVAGAGGGEAWADADPGTGVPATFEYHVDRERVPDWVREAVIYQLFVDRFAPSGGRSWNAVESLHDFWGGTLRGVIERLPYLEELGVTCLWLSPVVPSPTHHGYDATDYLRVESRLGSNEDLLELFEAAHALGIRVLLDYVANHVSDQHPAFRRACADDDAPERGWFTFTRWPDEYRSFFGVRSLPQIDTNHVAAREYLIEGAHHWLRRGADGFRLDYANGPSRGFWAAFRAGTRAVKSDSFMVGEVVETAELQRSYRGRLEGTLDFLLLQQMRAFFAFETVSAPTFDAFLRRHLAFFPDDFALPSFLDNHDMNRFLWVVRGDMRRLKLAALCQFTLPHPPIVYYGTEVGLSQRRDLEYPDGSRKMEESRTPMPWGAEQDAGLLGYYRDLIAARRAHGGLWRGERSTLAATADGLYVVGIEGAEKRAIVALNRSRAAQRVDLPADLPLLVATETGAERSGGAVRLPALSGALLAG